MRIVPGRIFCRTFPGRACYAGSADNRGTGAGRSRGDSEYGENKGKTAYFGGIRDCRFRGKVVQGDKLRLETKIIRQKGPVGIGAATASVDGKVVATAELTFMVG